MFLFYFIHVWCDPVLIFLLLTSCSLAHGSAAFVKLLLVLCISVRCVPKRLATLKRIVETLWQIAIFRTLSIVFYLWRDVYMLDWELLLVRVVWWHGWLQLLRKHEILSGSSPSYFNVIPRGPLMPWYWFFSSFLAHHWWFELTHSLNVGLDVTRHRWWNIASPVAACRLILQWEIGWELIVTTLMLERI